MEAFFSCSPLALIRCRERLYPAPLGTARRVRWGSQASEALATSESTFPGTAESVS
jgi:hypothetical protein